MSAAEQLDVFQDLFLLGPAERRPALRNALLDRIAPPWYRDDQKEKQLLKGAGDDTDILAFRREESDDLPGANLVLWSRSDGYRVANIVPLEFNGLGYSRYNAILQDFEQRIANPAAQQVGFRIEITPARQSIEDWLSPEAARALRLFSRAANKSTGSSHPSDRERWLQFVIEAHKSDRHLDTRTLARWLAEVEGWDDDHANELAIDYENGLDLLREYDHQQP